MKLTVFMFQGTQKTYKKDDRVTCGAFFKLDNETADQYQLGLTDAFIDTATLPIALWDNVLTELLTLKDLKRTTVWLEEVPVIESLLSREDYESAISNIEQNLKLSSETKAVYLSVFDKMKTLIAGGTTFKAKTNVTPESIVGCLSADSAAMRAVHHVNNLCDVQPIRIVESLKESKAKLSSKDIPTMLCDKLIYQWRPSKMSDDMTVYFHGSSELENKKSKVEQTEEHKKRNASYIYFGGSNAKLRVHGKVSAEDRYNVTILKKPFQALENLIEHQESVNAKLYNLKQMNVFRQQDLLSGGIGTKLHEDDLSCLTNTNTGDLYTTTLPRKEISYVFNPPRLAFKIRRILESNLTKLVGYIDGELLGRGIHCSDVTDQIYMLDEKDKPMLRPEITMKTKFLVLENLTRPQDTSKPFKTKVLMPYDLPTRNQLNKWTKMNPKVEMLTWELDANVIGYSFAITTDEGYLLYSSEYGSRHLLPKARKKNRTV